MALHRAGKANAERLYRELQRQLPGPAIERNPVFVADRDPREEDCMEVELQPQQTPLVTRQSHAAGICIEIATGNQGRMRPEIHLRILPIAGGKSGLRSNATVPGRTLGKP